VATPVPDLDPDAEDPVRFLVAKLRVRDALSEKEEQVLRDAVEEVRDVPAAKVLVRSGQQLDHSILLMRGIACRYKDLADGERQIQQLHVAGDFIDLHGFLLKWLDHNVAAVSGCRIALFPHRALKHISEEHPHLSRMLWVTTLLDAAIHRETILSIGRRNAAARIAHLLCELSVRLDVVGLSGPDGFDLPVTQADIADATGLTSVHVNRMLKQLRDQNMITFRQGRVVIHDWNRLTGIAEFDPIYLHLEQQPR
jgi:CRP-like cAMP-binding protein